jgi:hypothetical protein
VTEFGLDKFRVPTQWKEKDPRACLHGFPRKNRKGQTECVFCGAILEEAQ